MILVKPSNPVAAILKEVYIAWRFIDNDIYDTIVPSLLAFITAWIYADRPWREFPVCLSYALIYAALYIYTFCISNQLSGIEEDTINKPYRPLPTKMVSVKETWSRLIAYNILYLIIAFVLKIFWYSLAWVLVSFCLNLFGWSNHWISKNLVGMSLGTFILLNVQWKIADPYITPDHSVISYMIFLSLWAGFALPLQDLRDVEGDRKSNRKTLPISVGDRRARITLAVNFLTITPLLFICAMLTQVRFIQMITNAISLIIFLISIVIHWGIAYRILKYKTPAEDHRTYLIYVFTFCAGIPVICIIE